MKYQAQQATVFLLCFFINTVVFAQNKFEKESHVKEAEVPLQAVQWIKKYNLPKLKWYQEISERGGSYEAKFRFNGFQYSAEFDSLGIVEDVEVTCSAKQLGDSATKVIHTAIATEFGKQYKIKKIQLQLVPGGVLFDSLFFTDLLRLTHQYEIVLASKLKTKKGLYQVVINQRGSFLNQQKVVPPNLDVLEF